MSQFWSIFSQMSQIQSVLVGFQHVMQNKKMQEFLTHRKVGRNNTQSISPSFPWFWGTSLLVFGEFPCLFWVFCLFQGFRRFSRGNSKSVDRVFHMNIKNPEGPKIKKFEISIGIENFDRE